MDFFNMIYLFTFEIVFLMAILFMHFFTHDEKLSAERTLKA